MSSCLSVQAVRLEHYGQWAELQSIAPTIDKGGTVSMCAVCDIMLWKVVCIDRYCQRQQTGDIADRQTLSNTIIGGEPRSSMATAGHNNRLCEMFIDGHCRPHNRLCEISDAYRCILLATINYAVCLSMVIARHNRLCEMSIDCHCRPQQIVRDVYRWPLPATTDYTTYPSIAIPRYTRVNRLFRKLVQKSLIVIVDGDMVTAGHFRINNL